MRPSLQSDTKNQREKLLDNYTDQLVDLNGWLENHIYLYFTTKKNRNGTTDPIQRVQY
jgi:hypothetical protein